MSTTDTADGGDESAVIARPPAIEADLRELVRLIGPVIGGLKRGAAGPPPVIAAAFRAGSLGGRHAPVLMTLALDGALSVGELAKRLGLSLTTASLMVSELSRSGLVERTEDERDRRRTIVRLTPEHRELMDAWLDQRLEPLRRTLAQLTPEARSGFLAGWRALHGEVRRLRPADGDADCASADPQLPDDAA